MPSAPSYEYASSSSHSHQTPSDRGRKSHRSSRNNSSLPPAPTPPAAASISEQPSNSGSSTRNHASSRSARNGPRLRPRARTLSPRLVYPALLPEDRRWPPRTHGEAASKLRAGRENIHVFYYPRSTHDHPASASTRFPRSRHRSTIPRSGDRTRDYHQSQNRPARGREGKYGYGYEYGYAPRPHSTRRCRSASPFSRTREAPRKSRSRPRAFSTRRQGAEESATLHRSRTSRSRAPSNGRPPKQDPMETRGSYVSSRSRQPPRAREPVAHRTRTRQPATHSPIPERLAPRYTQTRSFGRFQDPLPVRMDERGSVRYVLRCFPAASFGSRNEGTRVSGYRYV